eukprot:3057067-Rhodomonas_salina.1
MAAECPFEIADTFLMDPVSPRYLSLSMCVSVGMSLPLPLSLFRLHFLMDPGSPPLSLCMSAPDVSPARHPLPVITLPNTPPDTVDMLGDRPTDMPTSYSGLLPIVCGTERIRASWYQIRGPSIPTTPEEMQKAFLVLSALSATRVLVLSALSASRVAVGWGAECGYAAAMCATRLLWGVR